MTAIETPRRWNTGRVEAFSDGVFAIAITLLVLDIRVEPEQYEDLGKERHLEYIDAVLLRINLLLLLAAAFLPFLAACSRRRSTRPTRPSGPRSSSTAGPHL